MGNTQNIIWDRVTQENADNRKEYLYELIDDYLHKRESEWYLVIEFENVQKPENCKELWWCSISYVHGGQREIFYADGKWWPSKDSSGDLTI